MFMCSMVPHNSISVNDKPHIWQSVPWDYNTVFLLYLFYVYVCLDNNTVTSDYSSQYSNMLDRLVPYKQRPGCVVG